MTSLILSLALLGQAEPHGGLLDGSLIERLEKRADQLRESLDRNAAESREWRNIFERIDGSRLANLADRIGTMIWLTFWVLIVAGVCFGLRQLAAVLESFGKAMAVWKGKT